MKYIITDGRQYVALKGREQTLTTDVRKAQQFDTLVRAKNFIANMKRTYSKHEWTAMAAINESSAPASCSSDIAQTIFEQEGFCWDKQVKDLERFFSQLDLYKEKLKRSMEETNKRECDIYHAIEFADRASASDGYRLFARMRDVLHERRKIKDELRRIGIIEDTSLDDIKANKVSPRLLGLESRIYTPRVMPELFGLEILKHK